MNPTRLLLLIVVLLAVGGGAWMLLNSDHTPSAPIEEPVATTTTEDKPPETGALSAQHGEQTEQAPAPARSEVKVDRSKRESQWGFFGKVVAPTGVPVKDCKVFLVESAQGTELFRFMQLAQRGVTLPPVASGATDEQGQFRLGVETFDPNKAFEVRVVSNDYADKAQGGLRLTTDGWVDAGVLQLEPGITVSGQVTVAGSAGMPIADAEVSIKSNLPFEVSVVPGRERGIVVRTDASGFYRATNVPPGVHTLSAVAPNYARLTIPNVTVNPQSPVTQNFELSPGLSIQGRVIDGTGQGVARARVVAVAMSSKTPVTGDTFTDENGGFEILGLLDGPYQLTAKAEGFVDANEKPISAGTKDVQLVVEKQGAVRLTVVGKNGQLVREYQVTVKSYFAGQPNPHATGAEATPNMSPPPAAEPSYGNTAIPVQHVRNPKDGVALIEGIDPGTYALQINARGYAMAFSEPFTLGPDTEPPHLTVQLNEGGVIAGVVVDANGAPVAGAAVETRPNDLDDNPFTVMFAGMIPSKVTRAQGQTDAQGRFEFKLLNAGRYQIKVSHPEYVETYCKDQEVVVGQRIDMPPIVLQMGSTLSGVVRVDGKPTGLVKVTVSSKSDPNAPSNMPRAAGFMCDAYTDNEGRYRMSKRLPPGLYEVMAAQQNLPNPLYQIIQFQRSKQEFSAAGQAQLVIDLNLEAVK
ncbi:MAG TPA: carboxypeptidase-like regulatory domain-containing protein [Planctomycetota bacterium]|nr:carboxypeptidase-like regulatory domain-containing protein [Planctomycetota bacterium]